MLRSGHYFQFFHYFLWALILRLAYSEEEHEPTLLEIAKKKDAQTPGADLLSAIGFDTTSFSDYLPSSNTLASIPPLITNNPPNTPPYDQQQHEDHIKSASRTSKKFSKSSQYYGWIQAGSRKDLTEFILTPQKPQIAKLQDISSLLTLIALRSNRRIGFNQYSTGYIGGYRSIVEEELSASQSNATLYNIYFFKNRSAIFQATNHGYFWALDSDQEKLVWSSKEAEAVQLEIFIHAQRRNILFLRYKSKFVSFRGPFSTSSDPFHPHGLTLISILCENAFFSAPSLTQNTVNSYVLKHRKKTLQHTGVLSPIFAPYDLALLGLMDSDLTEYKYNSIIGPYEWFNTLFTMTQVIVLDLPEYRDKFRAFGNKLAERLNINALLEYTTISGSSHWVRDGVYRLYTIATMAGFEKYIPRMEWMGLVGTMVTRAWMRDYDLGYDLLWDSNQTSVPWILRDFYKYSCVLAKTMLPLDTSLEERLDYLEILYPRGNVEPFLVRDTQGEYWFASYLSPIYSSRSIETMDIVPELKILYYLADDPRAHPLMLGAGIISVILHDTIKILESNSLQALTEYWKLDVIQILVKALPKLCPVNAKYLLFCSAEVIFSELALLVQSITSIMSSKDTTILSNRDLKDLQAVMLQYLDPTIQSLRASIQTTHARAIHAIAGDRLTQPDRIHVSSLFQKSYDDISNFYKDKIVSYEEKLSQWDDKMRILTGKFRLALDSKRMYHDRVEKFPEFRATGSAHADKIFEAVFCGLVRYIPFSAYFSELAEDRTLKDEVVRGRIIEFMKTLRTDEKEEWRWIVKIVSAYKESSLRTEALAPLLIFQSGIISMNVSALEANAFDFISTFMRIKQVISDDTVQEFPMIFSRASLTFCRNAKHRFACEQHRFHITRALTYLSDSIWQASTAIKLLIEIAGDAISQNHVYSIAHPKSEKYLSWEQHMYSMHLRTAIGVFLNRAILLKTTISYCNHEAYLEGERMDSICALTLFQNEPISDAQVQNLAQKEHLAWNELELNAYLPTQRLSDTDEGNIDIDRVMNGERVRVQIPQDIHWLKKMHFIPQDIANLQTLKIFVKEFHLYLLPRYGSFRKKKSRVLVNVRFDDGSMLGASQPRKRVDIPALLFVNEYEEWPQGYKGACRSVSLSPHTCMELYPRVCSLRVNDAKDISVMPSLFSSFEVQVEFPDEYLQSNEWRMDYSKAISPMYLDVRLVVAVNIQRNVVSLMDMHAMPQIVQTLEKIAVSSPVPQPTETNEIRSISKTLISPKYLRNDRQLEEPTNSMSRCCPVGYFRDWVRGKCFPCPYGTISQLGGIYCVESDGVQR